MPGMQEGWVVDVVQFGYREWGSEYLPPRTDRLHLAAKVPFCLSEGKYIPFNSEESVEKGSREIRDRDPEDPTPGRTRPRMMQQ